MTVQKRKERRARKRLHAVTELYVAGWGARRFRATNHSAEGLFVEFGRESLAELSEGKVLELIFVLQGGRLARIQRRHAVVTHLNPRGAGLHLYQS